MSAVTSSIVAARGDRFGRTPETFGFFGSVTSTDSSGGGGGSVGASAARFFAASALRASGGALAPKARPRGFVFDSSSNFDFRDAMLR